MLLILFLLSLLVGSEPVLALLGGILDGGLVVFLELVGKFVGVVNLVGDGGDVGIKGVLGVDFFDGLLVFFFELLSFVDHS